VEYITSIPLFIHSIVNQKRWIQHGDESFESDCNVMYNLQEVGQMEINPQANGSRFDL